MFLRLSKAIVLVAALSSALPAVAGNFNAHRHQSFHGAPGISFDARPQRFPGAIGFTGFDRGFRGRGHARSLREIYTSQPRYVNNTIIVAPQQSGSGPQGYGGGAGYAYGTNGGTYVSGYSYGSARAPRQQSLAPKAKVIDVAVADDPCSYEANVCVIRP